MEVHARTEHRADGVVLLLLAPRVEHQNLLSELDFHFRGNILLKPSETNVSFKKTAADLTAN